jgi:prepilin-type N-terminal cleavage/methylation domain-containing protein
MDRMRPAQIQPHYDSMRRRGVTLVEMLVVVALLVLVMTILVAIFRSATGAMNAAQTFDALDQNLRRMDSVIRRDLKGATARFTPPLNPTYNLGYFEYGENALSDAQGEDTDDYIAFTSKAPEGQPFVGRIWVPNLANPTIAGAGQVVTVTSNYAEIIYFLRGGNLYRRVLLVAPERGGSISPGFVVGPVPPLTMQTGGGFGFSSVPSPFGVPVSWQGLNDISCHPNPVGNSNVPIPNTLGDLTNRQNRFGKPRFYSDYSTSPGNFDLGTQSNNPGGTPVLGPDGVPDDENNGPGVGWYRDGIPDYSPTLYPGVFTANPPLLYQPTIPLTQRNPPAGPAIYQANSQTYDTMPFPFIFPGMFSRLAGGAAAAVPTNYPAIGAINPLDPSGLTFNHAPLVTGDSIAVPSGAPLSLETWWGFPTWRETMSPFWTDPILRTNLMGTTPAGASNSPVASNGLFQNPGLSWMNPALLPVVSNLDEPFTDGFGTATFLMPITVWQDDLILAGVRSFDVKAYDNSPRVFNPAVTDPSSGYFALTSLPAGYYDLGYEQSFFPAGVAATPPNVLNSFAHEGRIPPHRGTTAAPTIGFLDGDNRIDPQVPGRDVGDNQAAVLRLRRVWDSWSTDYAFTPNTPLYPGDAFGYGAPLPAYPSYPPPYPAPLRGIQIQIRLADPRNQYVKTLTIRQDFTDKL